MPDLIPEVEDEEHWQENVRDDKVDSAEWGEEGGVPLEEREEDVGAQGKPASPGPPTCSEEELLGVVVLRLHCCAETNVADRDGSPARRER
jgi:hypothetical protein